jgi:iron complex outermembrane receptor protein
MQETSDQQKQVSNEIRIISHDYSDVQWVAGFFYYDSEDILTNLAEDQVKGEGYMDVIFQSTAVAGFGSFTYPISDRIRLTAGGRLTDDQKEVSGYYDPPVPGFWETEWAYAESWTTLNFNMNLEYDVSDDSLLYFDVSTGHRPGNFTFGQEFDPEKLTAYELGMKNRLLDNTLQLNLASYYYNYKDYQAMDIVFMGGLPAPQIYNGQAKLAGAEFQANWLLSKADMLNVSLAYNHAEFTDLVIGDTDYQGKPLPHSPEYTATISYEHEFPLANGGYATFHADTRYETENRIMFTGTDDTTMEPDHHISNLSLAYNSPDGKLKLSTYIKNLENHAEKTQKFGPLNTVGAPRTYGAILTVSY